MASNDFFNLNSDSDSSSNENEEAKYSKWDWDNPANADIYFKDLNQMTTKSNEVKDELKRSHVESTDESRKRLCTPSSKSKEYEFKKTKIKYGNSYLSLTLNLSHHKDTVYRVNWCNMIENKNLLLSSSADCSIVIWDTAKSHKKQMTQLINKAHTKPIRNAIWSNYSTEIASVSYDKSCIIWNSETGQQINKFQSEQLLTALTNCPFNDNIYLIGAKNTIFAWDCRTCNTCKIYESQIGQVQDLLFVNDKEFISSGNSISRESSEYNIMAWDYETTAPLSNQIFHEKFLCTCLKKHPTYNLFFAQTHGGYIAEFSCKRPYKMNKFKRFEGHEVSGYNIGFDINPSGTLIISASSDGNAIIYNLQTSKIVSKLDAFTRPVMQPCMDAKFNRFVDNKIALSSWNGNIQIYESDLDSQ